MRLSGMDIWQTKKKNKKFQDYHLVIFLSTFSRVSSVCFVDNNFPLASFHC